MARSKEPGLDKAHEIYNATLKRSGRVTDLSDARAELVKALKESGADQDAILESHAARLIEIVDRARTVPPDTADVQLHMEGFWPDPPGTVWRLGGEERVIQEFATFDDDRKHTLESSTNRRRVVAADDVRQDGYMQRVPMYVRGAKTLKEAIRMLEADQLQKQADKRESAYPGSASA